MLVYLACRMMKTHREKRKRAVCAGNLRQIGEALFAYAADHHGCLPTIQDNAEGTPWDFALVDSAPSSR